MKVLNEFVDSNKSPSPPDPCTAVDQDGLRAVLGMADGPDGLHHVQHDLGVRWGCEVSPLLGLQVADLTNLFPVFYKFQGPEFKLILVERIRVRIREANRPHFPPRV